MYDIMSTAAARLGSVDPLAFLFLVGCLAFLWMIFKVVTDDRDLRGHIVGSMESRATAIPALRDERSLAEGRTGGRPMAEGPTGGRPAGERTTTEDPTGGRPKGGRPAGGRPSHRRAA